MSAPGPDDETRTPGPDETEPLRSTPPPPPAPAPAGPPGYPSYDQPPTYAATPPAPPPPPTVGYPVYDGAGAAQPSYYAGVNHQNATTSMWLGITGLVGALLTPMCCITLPLLLASPVAWVMGARARTAIDSTAPGTFANRGQAQAGFVLGIIGTVLGVLAVLALVAFGALLFSGLATAP